MAKTPPYVAPATAYKNGFGSSIVSAWNAGTATVKTGVGTCTADFDTGVVIGGANTLKITQGASGSGAAVVTLPSPINLAGVDNLTFALRFDSNIAANPGINKFWFIVYFSDGTFVNYAFDCKAHAPGTNHIVNITRYAPDNVNFTRYGGTDYFDSKTVTQVGVLTDTTSVMGVGANVWVACLGYDMKSKSKILLGFDGNYLTQKTILLPILEEFGLRANFYIQQYRLGQSGRFSVSDLDRIYALGHAVCMHSYSKDADYTSTASFPTATLQSDAVSEITQFAAWAAGRGYTRGAGHICAAIISPYDYSVGTQTQARMNAVRAALAQVSAKTYRLGSPVNPWATFESTDPAKRSIDIFVSQINSASPGTSGIDINSATEARSQVQYATRHGMVKMFYGHAFALSGASGSTTANRDVIYALCDEIARQIAMGKTTNPTIDEVFG